MSNANSCVRLASSDSLLKRSQKETSLSSPNHRAMEESPRQEIRVRPEIWSVCYENPVEAKSGFGRAIWSWSEALVSRDFPVRVVYLLGDHETAGYLLEKTKGVELYGVRVSAVGLTRRLVYYQRVTHLIDSLARKRTRPFKFGSDPFLFTQRESS